MKYIFVVLLACCLISPVLSATLNFQNPEDNESVQMISVGSPSVQTIRWIESPTGGNGYLSVSEKDGYDYVGAIPVNGAPTTYAAATLVTASPTTGRCQPAVSLYNIDKNTIYDFITLYDTWGGCIYQMGNKNEWK